MRVTDLGPGTTLALPVGVQRNTIPDLFPSPVQPEDRVAGLEQRVVTLERDMQMLQRFVGILSRALDAQTARVDELESARRRERAAALRDFDEDSCSGTQRLGRAELSAVLSRAGLSR